MDRHSFEYLSRLQNAITRKLEPVGLIYYAFNWHLIAWCHMRNDYRDFRVSRIQEMKDLGQPFTKNDHIELNDYMEQLPVAY